MNPDHYAIVIGLKNYPGFVDPPATLAGPEHDADGVHNWLADPQGGGLPEQNIKRIRSSDFDAPPDAPWPGHLDRDAFLWVEALATANVAAMNGRKVGRRLYVYMSGHGFSSQPRQGCLLTGDAGPGKATANIAATSWLQWWQDAGYFDEYVMLLDCCMNRMLTAVPSAPPLVGVTTPVAPGPTFIAFAAKRPLKAVETAVPQDADKFHGVFTWAFLDGVKGAAVNAYGTVTGHSMANWLRNALHHRFGQPDRDDPDVSQEPEIVAEDPGLIFASGIGPLLFNVTLAFPADAVGKTARLWSGNPPQPLSIPIVGAKISRQLAAGLYVVDIPDTGYRHGFEIVQSDDLTIGDKGPAVQMAPPGTRFRLALKAGDAANQVSITAQDFETIGSGNGGIDTKLSYGIYRSRIRIGHIFVDRVFLLDNDMTPVVDPGPAPLNEVVLESVEAEPRPPTLSRIASAVPFRDAPMPREYRRGQVPRTMAVPSFARDVSNGAGAELIVMARRSQGDSSPGTAPWSGVSVVDAKGKTVADLGVDGSRSFDPNPFALCSIELAPGSYYLRYSPRPGFTVEQALPVVRAWRLEAYLLRASGRETSSKLSLLMRRPGDVWQEDQNQRLEKAKIALVDERPVLGPELKELLLRKYTDPTEGIVGAHLLLIQAQHDAKVELDLLNEVVRNLRSLVGADHPDVEALSLRCPDTTLRRAAPVLAPPIFERSWRLLVEASQDNPELVPLALWDRVQATAATPPYLAWSIDPVTKAEYSAALVEAARVGIAAVWEAVVGRPRDAKPPKAAKKAGTPASTALAGKTKKAAAGKKPAKPAAKAAAKPSSGPVGEKKPEAVGPQVTEQARRFADAYQLPASALRYLRGR